MLILQAARSAWSTTVYKLEIVHFLVNSIICAYSEFAPILISDYIPDFAFSYGAKDHGF